MEKNNEREAPEKFAELRMRKERLLSRDGHQIWLPRPLRWAVIEARRTQNF
jgi:hypothetical protein